MMLNKSPEEWEREVTDAYRALSAWVFDYEVNGGHHLYVVAEAMRQKADHLLDMRGILTDEDMVDVVEYWKSKAQPTPQDLDGRGIE